MRTLLISAPLLLLATVAIAKPQAAAPEGEGGRLAAALGIDADTAADVVDILKEARAAGRTLEAAVQQAEADVALARVARPRNTERLVSAVEKLGAAKTALAVHRVRTAGELDAILEDEAFERLMGWIARRDEGRGR